MNGILLIDKPERWTSHDVVAKVRNKLRVKKVGHAGTLDPLATGLLILLIGNATKISQYIMNQDKRYEGEFCLGKETDSYDAEGDITATYEVNVSEDEIYSAAETFLGDQSQIPPMYSAKKINGKPLYKLARDGKEIEREPRYVKIHEFAIGEIKLPNISFEVMCSKGTYIRTLAYDMGRKLNCGAYLSKLRRTETGKFSLNQAVSLEDLLKKDCNEIENCILPITDIL